MTQIFLKEMKAAFNLREPKAKRPTNIYMVVRLNGKQYKLATGVKVYPEHWSKKKELAYISTILTEVDNANNLIVNENILRMKKGFLQFKEYICNHPNESNVELLKQYIMVKNKIGITNICLYIKQQIEKDLDITEGTKKNYYKYTDLFERFLRDTKTVITDFNEITNQTLKDFQKYLRGLENARTKDGKMSISYINTCVKALYQRLGTYVVPNGKMERTNWLNITTPIIKNKTDDYGIALRDDEIYKLWYYKCETYKEENVRDMFLLNCLTGQRISDTEKVVDNVESIMDITTIKLVQKKTGKYIDCAIIFELAKEILAKYSDGIPEISNNQMNTLIKEIAKKAGITGTAIKGRQSGTDTNVNTESVHRYELLSSHTGRRTFITLLKHRGWDDGKITMYSGHSDVRMVQHYTKIKSTTDYEIYEKTKKECPELILKMVGESVISPTKTAIPFTGNVEEIIRKDERENVMKELKKKMAGSKNLEAEEMKVYAQIANGTLKVNATNKGYIKRLLDKGIIKPVKIEKEIGGNIVKIISYEIV